MEMSSYYLDALIELSEMQGRVNAAKDYYYSKDFCTAEDIISILGIEKKDESEKHFFDGKESKE